jgi:hypothetical protein
VRRGQANPAEIDEPLLQKVAELPPAGQRWLKTALHAITTIEPLEERQEKRRRSQAPPARRARPAPPPSLDEVLSGEADLREQAEAYPELAEELKGIADIAELLREVGRQRRSLGEEILRESEKEDEPEDKGEGNGDLSAG